MLKSVLKSNGQFTITLVINEDDTAHIDIQSAKKGPDLTQTNDLVVLVDGKGVNVTSESRLKARAELGEWAPYAQNGFALMIRIHEDLDGWDFPPQNEDEEE